MDQEEIMTPELEAEIDSSWDDEGNGPVADDTFEDEVETKETQQDPETEPEVKPDTPAPAEVEEPKADQPEELFTLKNRDETKQVKRDELLAMAQKGWDYDKVREERDQLRAYRDEANPALSFIKALAQKSNMSVSDYIDYCRKQELMNAGINEATAQAQINIEKQQAAIDAAQAEQRAAQEEAQRKQEAEERKKEEQRADLVRFMQAFPDVKAESIPKEVWASVQKGIPLTTAYTMYKNRALEAELTALKQNAEARERTPGSMNTAGEKHIDPDFDGWDDD